MMGESSGTSASRPEAESEESGSPAEAAHHDLVGQPHDDELEGPIADAEAAADELSSDDAPMGTPGRAFNRRSPFFIGLAAAFGVAVAYGLIQLLVLSGSVLLLIGLALFIAIGLEPAVSWLVKRRWPRWVAVTAVMLLILGIIGGFLAAAVPAVVAQVSDLGTAVPKLLTELKDRSSWLGQLNDKYDVQSKLQSLVKSAESGAGFSGVLSVAGAVFGALADTVVVLVLVAYFLAALPRIRAFAYRLVPASRRPRTILIGDDILAKVGGYVLGNLIISIIAGALTYVWLLVLGVPYAVLLAVLVALLDFVPVVGSVIGGVVISLVALTVSVPVALATVGFVIAYRFLEDYVLVPKIIGRAVDVPALVTVIAVLVGGSLLGIVGALVAIPAAAALLLIIREVTFPSLDDS